jgi:diguanylate cyclase (GGDEF)-like protein/hemerythrin-like metal-binding protein/PAS domain S-box-containing protein
MNDDIFCWSDGFAIGLDIVDDQHRKLVSLLNQLAQIHTSKAGDTDLLRVFDELVSYTAYHFSTEEALMDEVGVSLKHAAAHRHAHRQFVEQAIAARERANTAPREVTGDVLVFLTNWLIQHILGVDRHLGDEIRKAQHAAGAPITVTAPPSGERTTEVLLEALDRLYIRLGQNTAELTETNRRLQQELTKSKQTEQYLRIAATAFEAQESIAITDVVGNIVEVNKAFSQITGYAREEVLGKNPRLLNSRRHDAATYADMWNSILTTGTWQGEVWNRRKDGGAYLAWLSITAVKDDSGVATHYVGTSTDITERKTAEDKIRHLAYYDQLTNLPNRRLMIDRLEKSLASCARRGSCGALYLIDLDHFKALNDTMGHAMGDHLLIEVGKRLVTCIRDGDTVAHIGGDEFVVIIQDLDYACQAPIHAERVADKIQTVLSEPYQLSITSTDGQVSRYVHQCAASIGITLYRDQTLSTDELIKRVEVAMYQAKEAGRNTHRFFDPEMQAAVRARAVMEQELRTAIIEEQFELYYQPQVDAQNQVIGAEALVRWKHPQRGMVPPCEFIPLAEETGLILPLGHWVIAHACKQLTMWRNSQNLSHLTLAVNVSARQFSLPLFVDEVVALLEFSGAFPERLKLELTESLLLENTEEIITKMLALKERRVGFSMDDFGTGYSSLSYLKRLPLDQLKIDQSFVRDILNHPNDAAIAKTIVALAQSLGLSVIAEGVETEGQRYFLEKNGCPTYQGFLFSRPVPVDEFEKLVTRH